MYLSFTIHHRAAFGTYLLSIALFVVNVRWGALHMLTTGMHKFQLYNADIEYLEHWEHVLFVRLSVLLIFDSCA